MASGRALWLVANDYGIILGISLLMHCPDSFSSEAEPIECAHRASFAVR